MEATLQSNLSVQMTHDMIARVRESYYVSSLPEALKAYCDDELEDSHTALNSTRAFNPEIEFVYVNQPNG